MSETSWLVLELVTGVLVVLIFRHLRRHMVRG
jgi:hypothetical protein